MMGPWLLFAALLNGAALALFQGSPLGREFGLFVERARVTQLGLVPSIAKARGGGVLVQRVGVVVQRAGWVPKGPNWP